MQINSKPLISIVTVCFNSSKTIRKTIESVLNQSYTNIEYIIVDGKSSDNTLAIIREYESDFNSKGINYKYISEPDNGIYDAMNKGVKMACGEWVGIINSDDWYESCACEIVAKNSSNVDVVYGLLRYWQNGEIERILQNYHTQWLNLTMAHPAIFIKKELYQKYGYFDLKYKLAADYNLVVNLTKQSEVQFRMIEVVIANFSSGGASSHGGFKLSNLEVLNIQYHFGYLPLWKYLLKKFKIKLWH